MRQCSTANILVGWRSVGYSPVILTVNTATNDQEISGAKANSIVLHSRLSVFTEHFQKEGQDCYVENKRND